MKDMGIIHCDKEQAIPLIIGKDTVYVHTEITEVPIENKEHPNLSTWKCKEIQYDKDEYIHLMSQRADFFEDCIAEMATKIY